MLRGKHENHDITFWKPTLIKTTAFQTEINGNEQTQLLRNSAAILPSRR